MKVYSTIHQNKRFLRISDNWRDVMTFDPGSQKTAIRWQAIYIYMLCTFEYGCIHYILLIRFNLPI
jgi:hypothetical protein